MINTPEFWVAIAFLIASIAAIKFIVPKLVSGLVGYQSSIENLFLTAETALKAAERKYAIAKANHDDLSAVLKAIEHDFECRVARHLEDWSAQRQHMLERSAQLKASKLHHAQHKFKQELYHNIVDACVDAVRTYWIKHFTSSQHKTMVVNILPKLPKLKRKSTL